MNASVVAVVVMATAATVLVISAGIGAFFAGLGIVAGIAIWRHETRLHAEAQRTDKRAEFRVRAAVHEQLGNTPERRAPRQLN